MATATTAAAAPIPGSFITGPILGPPSSPRLGSLRNPSQNAPLERGMQATPLGPPWPSWPYWAPRPDDRHDNGNGDPTTDAMMAMTIDADDDD